MLVTACHFHRTHLATTQIVPNEPLLDSLIAQLGEVIADPGVDLRPSERPGRPAAPVAGDDGAIRQDLDRRRHTITLDQSCKLGDLKLAVVSYQACRACSCFLA